MTPQEVANYLIGDEVPLDRAAVEQLEQKLGARLPNDLLSFLELRNGGATSPTASEKEPLSFRGGPIIEHFYCSSQLPDDWNVTSIRNYKLVTLREWLIDGGFDPTNVPAHWLVFGQNWGGDQFALDLSVDGGEVVYLDHEMLPLPEHNVFPNDEGTRRLGVTFAQFMEGLDVEAPFPGPSKNDPGPVARFLKRIFG